MRIYAAEDEERIRTQAAVRDWAHSGLLTADQGTRLAADVQVEFRRTNRFLRAALALFTAIIVGATVGLFLVTFSVEADEAIAAVLVVAAVVCYALAERCAGSLRFYRFGVEEMLAVGACMQVVIAGVPLLSSWHVDWSARSVILLTVGAAGALGLFLRFGFLYAAIGALVCTAAIPVQLHASAAVQRLLVATVCAGVFAIARGKAAEHRDDYLGEDYRTLQMAAWAGIYLALNVQITPGWMDVSGWFYWLTYAITWVLPPIGLRLGIRDKDRALLNVSGWMTLVTLITSKSYLGWVRHTWDPIVLGVVLIGGALGLRRWLADGPGGERDGFTPVRLLKKDDAMLSMLGAASLIRPGDHASTPAPAPAPEPFDGGRSGGAGGGAGF